jgi:putative methyltransferase (TIGR04325 family)
MKQFIRAIVPPVLYEAASKLKRRDKNVKPDLEYVPDGWSHADQYKGWNAESVLQACLSQAPAALSWLNTTGPMNVTPGAHDINAHNVMLSFAYALSVAARHKSKISMLDWGGFVGHYYQISRALLPDLEIDYHCKDLSLFSEYGRTQLPEAHFYSDDRYVDQSYDFVLISSALQYSQDWQTDFAKIASCTSGHLFLTRTPSHLDQPSYVFSQSAYGSEWLGWSFNRDELLAYAAKCSLQLVREFLMYDAPMSIHNAPAPCNQRGYLFRKLS